jgi:hypothetical protein
MWDMSARTPARGGWVIELQGDAEFLDWKLAYYLLEGPARVFKRENQFYLQADEIDAQPDFQSAEQEALKLLRTMCGLFGEVATREKARPVAAIQRYADGTWGERKSLIHLTLDLGIGVLVRVPTDRPQRALALALRDSRLRWALDDFAGEPDFPRLRRVYETMWKEFDEDQGNAELMIVAAGLANKAELKRFRKTVNAGSKEAAHSTYPKGACSGAMTLTEARSYLRDLLNRWIDAKLQKASVSFPPGAPSTEPPQTTPPLGSDAGEFGA